MTEKQISLVSKNYAKALIEISDQDNSFAKMKEDLFNVLNTVASSNDLKLVMDNSSISISKKTDIINEIFSDKIDGKVLNFLKILVVKNRFNELNSIVESYNEMSDNLEKKKNVEIISAFELDIDVKGQILSALEKKLNGDVIPQWTVDESIIAGLMFKFGDVVIDTSVRAKLENLSKYMLR